MTATHTAATQIAAAFATLDTDDLNALHSDDGLTITVDGTDVAVWHRQEDNMIVAFTSPDGDTEEWSEVAAPTLYSHATCHDSGAADHDGSIFLHHRDGSGPDGTYTWAEIVDTARQWGEVTDDLEPELTIKVDAQNRDAGDGVTYVTAFEVE